MEDKLLDLMGIIDKMNEAMKLLTNIVAHLQEDVENLKKKSSCAQQ